MFQEQLKQLKVQAKVMQRDGKKGYNFMIDKYIINKFQGTLKLLKEEEDKVKLLKTAETKEEIEEWTISFLFKLFIDAIQTS